MPAKTTPATAWTGVWWRALLIAALVLGSVGLASGPVLAQGAGTAATSTTVRNVLPYQGLLLDPATGEPRPDGEYSMTFRLYTTETGGSAIWTEGKTVQVSDGIFSTFLGDATPLNLDHFDGQNLWLGVTVGSDSEATPRIRLGFMAYSFYAENAATATNAANAESAVNAQNAANLGGKAPSEFAAASHNHNASAITSGTLDGARIPSGIARDSEIFPNVLDNDGAGSGLNADLLDGMNSSDFALAGHSHSGTGIGPGDVGDEEIADRTRTLSFPANSLNYDPTSSPITQESNGLEWGQSFSGGAFLNITAPDDWDGSSDVLLTIYFYPTTNTAGNVDFFIRPRAYDMGDDYGDVPSLSADPVKVAASNIVNKQVFTIPASRFGNREMWVITIQNQGAGSTYPDPVRVTNVSLSYNAVR